MIDALVYPTARDAAAGCAQAIADAVNEALEQRGAARIALSGGSTPLLMFEAMRTLDAGWALTDWFWVDERCVPPDHELSNYSAAARHLLEPLNVPAARIHRVRGELPPAEAALRYEEEILAAFGGEFPVFDVLQMGLGADAHTASLFPGEPLIESRDGVAAAVFVEKIAQWRVTLLPGVLFEARARFVLATGADKADPLRRITRDDLNPLRLPGQLLLAPLAPSRFFVDEAAAVGIEQC